METVCRKPGVQTPCAKHDRKQLPSIYLSVWVAGCLMPCSQAFYLWSLATWCMMGSDHSPGVKTLNCPFNHRSIEMLRNLGFTCSSVCSQTCAINRLQRALQKGKLLIALVFVSLGAAGEGGGLGKTKTRLNSFFLHHLKSKLSLRWKKSLLYIKHTHTCWPPLRHVFPHTQLQWSPHTVIFFPLWHHRGIKT